MNTASKTHLPKRKKHKQTWLSSIATEIIAEKRRLAKCSGFEEEWRKLNQAFNKQAIEDKRVFLEEKCNQLERNHNNPKAVFRLIKEITGKWSAQADAINDTNGNTLTEEADIKKRWAHYCEELYSKDIGDQDVSLLQCQSREPLPLRAEVEFAMKQMVDGKSPSIDELPAELWKLTGKEGIDLLWKLCRGVWTDLEWPKDWCRTVFVTLHKKGSKKECSNYRTISLIVHASKILLKIIINRIKAKYSAEMSEEQAGFVHDRGIREHIVNIRQIIQKCKGHNFPLYMCFIYYSKAFDCVSHFKLWNILTQIGFPEHLTNLMSCT